MTIYKAVLTLERSQVYVSTSWVIYSLIAANDLTEAVNISKEIQFQFHCEENSSSYVSTELCHIEDMTGKIVWSCFDEQQELDLTAK